MEKQAFELLLKQAKALLEEEDRIAALANCSALIYEFYQEKCSWAGFYLNKGNELVLGPFQGKVACTRILYNHGVCGKAAVMMKTLIVPNVHEFEGHIACDSESNSEIVVCILKNGSCLGVIDLDSYQFNAFNEEDADALEKLSALIADYLYEN